MVEKTTPNSFDISRRKFVGLFWKVPVALVLTGCGQAPTTRDKPTAVLPTEVPPTATAAPQLEAIVEPTVTNVFETRFTETEEQTIIPEHARAQRKAEEELENHMSKEQAAIWRASCITLWSPNSQGYARGTGALTRNNEGKYAIWTVSHVVRDLTTDKFNNDPLEAVMLLPGAQRFTADGRSIFPISFSDVKLRSGYANPDPQQEIILSDPGLITAIDAMVEQGAITLLEQATVEDIAPGYTLFLNGSDSGRVTQIAFKGITTNSVLVGSIVPYSNSNIPSGAGMCRGDSGAPLLLPNVEGRPSNKFIASVFDKGDGETSSRLNPYTGLEEECFTTLQAATEFPHIMPDDPLSSDYGYFSSN